MKIAYKQWMLFQVKIKTYVLLKMLQRSNNWSILLQTTFIQNLKRVENLGRRLFFFTHAGTKNVFDGENVWQ